MIPERFRHIAIEGPIGVGKTSLAQRLAARLDAELLLEQPQDNPFLPRFYEDPKRYALPVQLFFLMARTEQAARLSQGQLFSPLTVSDYILEKDPLFARANLDETEFRLYQKLYEGLRPQAAAPDLVIYLQAPPAVLLDRIRRRNREYERALQEGYLAELGRAYSEFFYHYDAAPLLIVNTERLNFADNLGDFELLFNRIRDMRGAREFFNLGA
jgi:deoxyguanosine kinase